MGTKIVAGVTPGKEGQYAAGIPVFSSVRRAVAQHPADAAIVFVPPLHTHDAVLESLDAGIQKIVTIADGIPLHDQVRIRAAALSARAQIVGGNTSGVISVGQSMLGIFPYWIDRVYNAGNIGIMTRSGSLTNEVTSMIVKEGFGVSTLIGVGGDPVPAARFAEFLPAFQEDTNTQAVVIVGELGGTMEEEAAQVIQDKQYTKPLVAFICGHTAPKNKRMGHAGAIVQGGIGSVESKISALTAAGAAVAKRPKHVGTLLSQLLKNQPSKTL